MAISAILSGGTVLKSQGFCNPQGILEDATATRRNVPTLLTLLCAQTDVSTQVSLEMIVKRSALAKGSLREFWYKPF